MNFQAESSWDRTHKQLVINNARCGEIVGIKKAPDNQELLGRILW